jgi:predicted HD superfamily hydrolase involved in NAD metabolism
VDAGELLSRRKVYTVETLERLAAENPGARLHFVTGSDSAAGFSRWKEPRKLARLASWWTVSRPGEPARAPRTFRRVPGRMPAVSSTALRSRLARGEKCAGELSPAVERYIAEHGLYGGSLLDELRKSLAPNRFEHTLAVAKLAEALARRWDEDAAKARAAGLLHDCGRALPVPELPAYAKRMRLDVPDRAGIERHNPLLLHAYVGEDLARRRFGVRDRAVLSAIRQHTLGGPRMSRLDRLVYVADACSEDRGYPEAAELRALAFQDLDEAFRGCVLNKIKHALAQGAWLHPLTVSVWNSLQG